MMSKVVQQRRDMCLLIISAAEGYECVFLSFLVCLLSFPLNWDFHCRLVDDLPVFSWIYMVDGRLENLYVSVSVGRSDG